MKNKFIALALSVTLSGSIILSPALVMAESRQPVSNSTVTLKSAISRNNSYVELTLGKAQIVHLSVPAKRVSISNPEVVGIVLISPTEVQLIGKAIGSANLLVWGENTGQNYLSIDLSVHRDVMALANKIQMIDPGINILPVAAEDSVILTGVAESAEKAQLAYDLTKAFLSGGAEGSAISGAMSGEEGSKSSSNSPGSSTFAETSTQIVNLIRIMGQPATKAEMVQERLKDIDPNIKLNVVPGAGGKEKAILNGRVKSASMVSKAINLASIFYGAPGIKVLTGPGGNAIATGAEGEAPGAGSKGGVGLIGNLARNILNGSVVSDSSGNVVSMLEVNERPQIKCSIKFIEVQKSNDMLFNASTRGMSNDIRGTGYSGTHGQFIDTDGNQVLINDVNTFFYQVNGYSLSEVAVRWGKDFATLLSGLITKGKAKVLAEPTITSISGEPANFLAGGEVPIPLASTNGVTVVFKEFGIRLEVLPTVTDRGTIHMQISPEVSTIDPSAGINFGGVQIPGFRTRKSQTVLEMKDGDNFVLSGLYNESMTDVLAKTPILGQIPILGNLFRSKNFQEEKTEMIIVIHPEIQHGMDLDYVASKPQSEVKQTQRLNPEEVYKDFAALNKKNNNEKAASKNLTGFNSESSQKLSSKEKKALLKEIKRDQKRMEELSRQISKGETPSPQPSPPLGEREQMSSSPSPALSQQESSPETQKVTQQTDSEKSPLAMSLYAAEPLSSAAKGEEFMATQKKKLSDLIEKLEQQDLNIFPAVEIPLKNDVGLINQTPTNDTNVGVRFIEPDKKTPTNDMSVNRAVAPTSEKQSSVKQSKEPDAQKTVAPVKSQSPKPTPAVNTEPTKASATEDNKAVKENPETQPLKPSLETKTVPSSKLATNPKTSLKKSSRQLVISKEAKQLFRENIDKIQKGLSQFLGFNGF